MEYLSAKGAPEMLDIPEPKNQFFWNAYAKLRRSRNIGMGFGGIPLTEIMAYADHCGITCPVQRHRLVRIVSAMDAAEIEQHGKTVS